MAEASNGKTSPLKGGFDKLKKALGNRRSRAIGYVLIGATAVILLYLFLIVGHTRRFLETRNFRSLAAVGKQIESVLDSQVRILRSSGTVEVTGTKNPTTSRVTIRSPVTGKQTFSLESPILQESKERDDDALDLVFLFYRVRPRDPWLISFQDTEETEDKSSQAVKATARPLTPLVQPLLQRPEFDHIFILDEDGNVILEQDGRQLRLDKFKEREEISWMTETEANGEADEAPGLEDGLYRRVKLGGQSYELFLMPLVPQRLAKLPLEDEDEATDGDGQLEGPEWRLGGLIRTERFDQATYNLPVSWILVLFGMVLLSLALLPIVKARWLGKRQSLPRTETIWLILSLLVLTAALAAAPLLLWQRTLLWGYVDEQLKTLADQIQENLQTETGNLYEDLDKLRNEQDIQWSQLPDHLDAFKNAAREHMTPNVNNVYVIEPSGQQKLKINHGKQLALLNVSEREYFRRFLRDSKDRKTAFVQSIHSWTTGQPEVVLAMPADPSDDPEDSVYVLAAAARLSSVIDPLLPTGYGFAIVQGRTEPLGPTGRRRFVPTGDVLLHSDSRLNLRSNVLEDTEESEWLEATLLAGTTDLSTLRYRGRQRYMWVQPLEPTEDSSISGMESWRIVTFADSAPWNAWIIQTLGLWFFLFVLYLALLFLLYRAYRAVHPTGTRGLYAHLWFDPRREYLWLYLLAPFLLVLVCAGLSLRFPWCWWILVGLAIGPLLWLVFADKSLGSPGATDGAPRLAGYRRCVVLSLLTLAFLPSFAFYAMAFDLETELFLIQGQHETAQAEQERAHRNERREQELRYEAEKDRNPDDKLEDGWSFAEASWPEGSADTQEARSSDLGRYDESFFTVKDKKSGWTSRRSLPSLFDVLRVPWTLEGQRSDAFVNKNGRYVIEQFASTTRRGYRLKLPDSTSSTRIFSLLPTLKWPRVGRLLWIVALGLLLVAAIGILIVKAFRQIRPVYVAESHIKEDDSPAIHFVFVASAKWKAENFSDLQDIRTVDLRGAENPPREMQYHLALAKEGHRSEPAKVEPRFLFLLDEQVRSEHFQDICVHRFGLVVPLAHISEKVPRKARREDLDPRIVNDLHRMEQWFEDRDLLHKLKGGSQDLFEPLWHVMAEEPQAESASDKPATETTELPELSTIQTILLHLAKGDLVATDKLHHELKVLYRGGLAEPTPQPTITNGSWRGFLLGKENQYRGWLKTVEDEDAVDAVPVVRLILYLLGLGGLLFLGVTQGEIVQEATTQIAIPLGIVAALISLARTWRGLGETT